MESIETEHGYLLTLYERKIMKLIVNEAQDRASTFIHKEAVNTELDALYHLIGDYIAAFKDGRLSLSDFERCG